MVRWSFVFGILGASIGLLAQGAIAQVVSDGSIGTIVTPNGTTYEITGGITVGQNLFHSFDRFNIPTDGIADFQNNPSLVNLFSRVTGRSPAEIDGVIRSRGTTNFFLLSPAGILFGPNSRLNVGGSFLATTANALQFPNGELLSASISNVPSTLLAVNPSAFLFNQIDIAPIQINSRNLYVGDRQSLVLLGGDVTLESGVLGVATMIGGRADLGGLAAPGNVALEANSGIFRLNFPSNVLRADVSLKNRSRIDVTAHDGGSIGINARNLILQNSQILAGINGGSESDKSKAGDIDINTTGDVRLIEGSRISNSVFENNTGNSGNISIQTRRLVVYDSKVVSAVAGTGKAGDLTVYASDLVDLNGEGQGPGGLLVQIEDTGIGQGGNLFLRTERLSVSDGSKIQVASFGDGNAGNLFVNAISIDLIESSKPNIYSTSINASLASNFGSNNVPSGNGGNLTIETERLKVSGGASVSVSTDGIGNAGKLSVYASDFIELSGDSGENGGPGGLLAQVNPGATGNGGNLIVETKRLSVSDGSKVQVSTFGDGNAGNLFIKASEIDVFNTPGSDRFFSTSINADVGQDSRFPGVPKGNGGDLKIETGRLSIRSGAEVTVDTSGQGNAGTLLVQAKNLVEVIGRNSFLTADVNSRATGSGGTLTVQTKQLRIQEGGQVGSSTTGIGNAGNVFIRTTDLDIVGVSANGNPSGLFSTSSQNARGNGGNLFVEARNLNLSNRGQLSSRSRGVGSAGNIIVDSRNILMRNNSNILTISNAGDGGNITLSAKTIVALEDSNILAFAPAGKGGQITFIDNRAFLSNPLYRSIPPITDRAALNALQTNGRVDVNASGTVSGAISGVPDISFLQNSLTQLPNNQIDTNKLLAQTCLIRQDQPEGTFYITGTGSLPNRPNDPALSDYPTNTIQPTTQTAQRPWKLGDPIIEPQGFYKLADGRFVMSRECSQ
jgi:filamentous hemagglutinin family protein